MAKVSAYLIDGTTNKPSSARLNALWGLLITGICCIAAIVAWIFATIEPNMWIAAICCAPGIIGCIPLCVQYAKRVKELIKAVK